MMLEYLYLSVVDDGEQFEFVAVDTLSHPLDFLDEVDRVRKDHKKSSEEHSLNITEVYGCFGPNEEVLSFEDHVAEVASGSRYPSLSQIKRKSPEGYVIKRSCVEILRAQVAEGLDFKIGICRKQDAEVPFAIFLLMNGAAYASRKHCQIAIEQLTDAWLGQEEPFLLHRQVMTNGFMIRGVKGKRIIAPYFNSHTHVWELLLEGARRLDLNGSLFYVGKQSDSSIVGSWTEPDVELILMDPVYGFGVYFECGEVLGDWLNALLYCYALSFYEKEWDFTILRAIYLDFLGMLKERFSFMEVQPIVDEETFLMSFRETARRRAEALRGIEESELTRRFASEMPHRVYQLKALMPLLEKHGLVDFQALRKNAFFDRDRFNMLLDACNADSAAKKGRALEDATACMLEALPSWRLAGRCVRADDCEIDLCYVNQSFSQQAWDLGCMLLVECKNRVEQTGVAVLRNLSFVMDAKGAKAGLIVSASGFTKVVREQVRRLATQGKVIFLMDGACLKQIANGAHPDDIIAEQYASLMRAIEDDFGLLC